MLTRSKLPLLLLHHCDKRKRSRLLPSSSCAYIQTYKMGNLPFSRIYVNLSPQQQHVCPLRHNSSLSNKASALFSRQTCTAHSPIHAQAELHKNGTDAAYRFRTVLDDGMVTHNNKKYIDAINGTIEGSIALRPHMRSSITFNNSCNLPINQLMTRSANGMGHGLQIVRRYNLPRTHNSCRGRLPLTHTITNALLT